MSLWRKTLLKLLKETKRLIKHDLFIRKGTSIFSSLQLLRFHDQAEILF